MSAVVVSGYVKRKMLGSMASFCCLLRGDCSEVKPRLACYVWEGLLRTSATTYLPMTFCIRASSISALLAI